MIVNNAMRLNTLAVGSPEYIECVELVKADLEQYANVTEADQARIGRDAYKELYDKELHACGCCGARDPAVAYVRSPPLDELSADHWLRASPEFVARVTSSGSVTLMGDVIPNSNGKRQQVLGGVTGPVT